jgi:hypothetical protein
MNGREQRLKRYASRIGCTFSKRRGQHKYPYQLTRNPATRSVWESAEFHDLEEAERFFERFVIPKGPLKGA